MTHGGKKTRHLRLVQSRRPRQRAVQSLPPAHKLTSDVHRVYRRAAGNAATQLIRVDTIPRPTAWALATVTFLLGVIAGIAIGAL